MIENRHISTDSYSAHAHIHEHEITKCLHETLGHNSQGGGGGIGKAVKAASQPQPQKTEGYSFKDLFTDGFRSLIAKASGFWRKLGEEGGQEGKTEKPEGKDGRKTVGSLAEGSRGINGAVPYAGSEIPAAILGTAMVKPKTEKEESPEMPERRVNHVDGAVNGGLKRGQGGIRKFLHKFKEAAERAGRPLRKKTKTEAVLPENNTDFNQGDNSFLMDSYNRMGEYSSLAKDRSLEGSFQARR